jgi:HAD superfamily hydrolase (TIGR01662 family)
VDELLGPLGPWLYCPHAPEDGCDCRKPAPGLVREAARWLGVAPERCVVIGDIGADVEAARAAGARAVLVPTPRTRPEEVAAAPATAPDLAAAVEIAIGARA